jgi:hypothetical protein
MAKLPHELAQLYDVLQTAEAEAPVTLAYIRERKADPKVRALAERMAKRLRAYADALDKELK